MSLLEDKTIKRNKSTFIFDNFRIIKKEKTKINYNQRNILIYFKERKTNKLKKNLSKNLLKKRKNQRNRSHSEHLVIWMPLEIC